ncbi:hypothetical protein BT69DRAFT_1346823, partial [Atractiella rhizophila]
MITRPKVLVFLCTLIAVFILLLPSHNRQAAHSVLKTAGIDFDNVNYTEWRGNVEGAVGGFGKSFSEWVNSVSKGWEDQDASGGKIVGGMGDGRVWDDSEEVEEGEEDVGETEFDFDIENSGSKGGVKEEVDTTKPFFHQNGLYVLPPSYLSPTSQPSSESEVEADPVSATESQEHPVAFLIRRAQEQWAHMLDSAPKLPPSTNPSKLSSYKAFYDAYRSTHKRHPPKGYDRFLAFCQKHNVKLPHLLSTQIAHDLAPFWGLEPNDLRHRSNVMANERGDTFTIHIKTGEAKAEIYGEAKDLKRATDLTSLIERFVGELKGLGLGWKGLQDDPASYRQPGDGFINFTLTRQDLPAVALGWEQRERLVELGKEGECKCFSSSSFSYES